MAERLTFCVEDGGTGVRLDVFLAARCSGLSRSRIQRLIEAGHVSVNDASKPGRHLLRAGERVVVDVPDAEPAVPQPEQIPFDVVYADDDLLVINKPAGLVVHPGAGQPGGTLVNALLGRSELLSSIGGVLRPGIVHRLDKDTSGLMLVARNDRSHRELSAALSRREIHRIYRAIVLRAMPQAEGTVDAPVGRHHSVRTKMCVGGVAPREARTHWRVVERFHGFALVECRLETGRTHQVRVHMAHVKHPVLGDELYGGGAANASGLVAGGAGPLRKVVGGAARQMLHACRLEFAHPVTGEKMVFECAPPADFERVLQALRRYAVS